mgnify:CR=1 FL=1
MIGCYTMSAAEYHRDPCPTPSLSASIARELLASSPLHAWWASPLNPERVEEEAERFDIGTAAHAYILEGSEAFVIIEADDWRTKKAREDRDAARLAGKVPLLAARWADVRTMATTIRARLAQHGAPIPFTVGTPEQVLVWQEGDVWCRARLDWLHDDHRTVDDLKTTGATANPAVWTRGALYSSGYDIQAAFYLRGVQRVFGVEAEFRFVIAETSPPYAVSVVGLGPEAMALAEKKVRAAIETWHACLVTGAWPGYPTRTCWADLPSWEETRWMEREYRDAAPVVDDGRPFKAQMFGRVG